MSAHCKRAGILLNAADNPALCDFILPATVKRGDLTISVSSQGKAPFFTKETKRKIAGLITPTTAAVMELAGEFRRRLLSNANLKSKQDKERAYTNFLSTDWEKLLETQGRRKSYRRMENILKETEETQNPDATKWKLRHSRLEGE